jgi:hypothetical protein
MPIKSERNPERSKHEESGYGEFTSFLNDHSASHFSHKNNSLTQPIQIQRYKNGQVKSGIDEKF